jgi:uncharacterized membrane protein required for colicin V production
MPRLVTLNWIDWVTAALVLVSAVRGARFGFWVAAADVVLVVAGFLAASALYAAGAEIVTRYLPMVSPSWASLIAFVVIWVVVYFPLSRLARTLRDVPFPARSLTGAVLGAARGFVVAAAVLVVALAAPSRDTVARDADGSMVAPYLLEADSAAMKRLPNLPVSVPQIGPGGKMF